MKLENKNIYRKDIDGVKVERISINLRIPKDVSIYLKEKNLSPTGIFLEAIKELRQNGTEDQV